MSIATVNRTLQQLRASRAVDFQRGQLHVRNWDGLVEIAELIPAICIRRNLPFDVSFPTCKMTQPAWCEKGGQFGRLIR
jgi:hypothetical protein